MAASATLFLSPPLRRNGEVSAYSDKPRASRVRTTCFSTTSGVNPKFLSPNATSSLTVSENSRWSGFWKTSPTFLDSFATLTFRVSSPSTRTRPWDGFNRPFRCLASVVFPAPFSPIIAIKSPPSRFKSMSCRAVWPDRYVKETFSSVIIDSSCLREIMRRSRRGSELSPTPNHPVATSSRGDSPGGRQRPGLPADQTFRRESPRGLRPQRFFPHPSQQSVQRTSRRDPADAQLPRW